MNTLKRCFPKAFPCLLNSREKMEYHRNKLKRKLEQLQEEEEEVKSDLKALEGQVENHLNSILYAFEEDHELIVTAKKCQELLDKHPDTCEETTIIVEIPYRFTLQGYKGREPKPSQLDHDSVYEAIFEKLPKNCDSHISDLLIYHVEETYSNIKINTQDARINYHEQPMIGSHTFPMNLYVYKNLSPKEEE